MTGPNPPSVSEDALTRLWGRADASHGQSLEAVAELRERKRREQEASRPHHQRPRRGESAPHEAARVDCERCRRTVDRASSEWVLIPSPVAEPAQHMLCSRCAEEVRHGLVRLLAGQEPLPAREHEEQELPPPIPVRAGWFALRMGAYGLIALVVFALVSWISVR
jgi:hypothetical protein